MYAEIRTVGAQVHPLMYVTIIYKQRTEYQRFQRIALQLQGYFLQQTLLVSISFCPYYSCIYTSIENRSGNHFSGIHGSCLYVDKNEVGLLLNLLEMFNLSTSA
jgi:hypothetical protein